MLTCQCCLIIWVLLYSSHARHAARLLLLLMLCTAGHLEQTMRIET
jgi:hypothetical protein